MSAAVIIPVCLFILITAAILSCYLLITWTASPFLFGDASQIPFHETALVLGTAKLTVRGGLNRFFSYRIEAATRLFNAGKSSKFIMSGADKDDRILAQSDEMKDAMVARGTPASLIISDGQSYRTWDSLWRCRNVYLCSHVTVVSQRFHTERAVFIARKMGMEVAGFNAPDVKGKIAVRMFLRESAARVKCILDCYLLHPVPRYLKKHGGRNKFFW